MDGERLFSYVVATATIHPVERVREMANVGIASASIGSPHRRTRTAIPQGSAARLRRDRQPMQ